jgi:pyruvate/2-oxoglutarate dehydrogenase complex dihydrolipoamide dehydrogenase (E3) component
MKMYDYIIIGSGQAGNPLAHKLSDLGNKVALIERDHLGGSCVNYGCTPTKKMVASARVAHVARMAGKYGVNTGEVSIDMPKIVALKNEIVAQWRGGQEHHTSSRDRIDLYRGHGKFVDTNVVEVNGEQLTAKTIFINTGTSPLVLPIQGIEDVDYLTNRNVMDLEELPAHLIVIGGSYIGLEFGQMYRRFGAEVTVVEFADQLIPREDADVAEALQEVLENEGIVFHLGSKGTAVSQAEDGTISLTVEKDGVTTVVTGSHILLAAGRKPNTDGLGLENAGISHTKGWITVNHKLETNVPGVYALGDVTGGPAFTHTAYDDHLIVMDNLIKGEDKSREGRIVPYALFTDPELGRVGLTEKAAKEAGYRLKVGKIPMAWVARAIERDETAGLMKIVIDADTDKILGAAILGIEGGEIVQTLMALMMADAPWTLFFRAMFIHPTLTEGFFTLMDNVKLVEDKA